MTLRRAEISFAMFFSALMAPTVARNCGTAAAHCPRKCSRGGAIGRHRPRTLGPSNIEFRLAEAGQIRARRGAMALPFGRFLGPRLLPGPRLSMIAVLDGCWKTRGIGPHRTADSFPSIPGIPISPSRRRTRPRPALPVFGGRICRHGLSGPRLGRFGATRFAMAGLLPAVSMFLGQLGRQLGPSARPTVDHTHGSCARAGLLGRTKTDGKAVIFPSIGRRRSVREWPMAKLFDVGRKRQPSPARRRTVMKAAQQSDSTPTGVKIRAITPPIAAPSEGDLFGGPRAWRRLLVACIGAFARGGQGFWLRWQGGPNKVRPFFKLLAAGRFAP